MKRIFALFVFLFLAIPGVQAAEFLPFDGPRPLAVLIETDPWLMVIDSDTPSFVLYENGQVIFRKRSETKNEQYLWKQLSPEELQSLKAKLAAFGPFRKDLQHIALTAATDQPETRLYLKFDDTALVTSIYGMGSVDASPEENRRIKPLPADLRKLYAFLTSIEFKGATEWTPKYIEAIVWDYAYAIDASVSWPKTLPGLNSPTTIKRKSGYSIFLPAADLQSVSALLATRKTKGAIEIDGKKMMVTLRPTFPSEPVWRKAFSD